ncbi:protein kinase domain-containing protein [Streptomyces chromofuscus]|uniref:PQQ-binding-like beta-propeller repeat protein n=1 Tax=Streptomyces chromofuscus TaxID=42881 RepID=A0A7M2T430_STRCW|nr:serine/threonine-protein kinase [Streptomyces chromofuscus]QOV42231.1 PQQ-binding-like beta-propeller repeat protein [Streptomyces chromofuscus]GGS84389.1 serine/threonine protein kinase [Streptomyces chromofuscus]
MPPWRNTGTDAEAESQRYAGHYLLEALLGSGGMGVVHLARSASGLRLAVKVVHAEFAQDPEFRGRFRQEVGAARRVSGAFTAPVVDADPDAERPWMATLYIPGPTLSEYVKRNGALPLPRLRQLMAGLAEALRDIHRVGVVHRDLKPSNVLLAEDGPKVIDFGISRPSDSELRTETGKLIGTPPFMAPEQFRRPRDVGPAADVFALGSVIVHAATGSGPFDSDSPYLVAYQVVHEEADLTGVPQELVPLVARCLAKEPEDRPTPDELMAELRSLSASYDTQAFIPEQRTADRSFEPHREPPGDAQVDAHRRPPADPHRRRPGAPSGDDLPTHRRTAPAVPDSATTDTAPRSRAGRRRWWTAVAATAAVLALGAGAVVLAGTGGSEAAGGQGPAPRFRAWDVDLGARGAEASGMPQCAYGGGTLYCTRPGVLAAAVDSLDGTVEWARADSGQRADGNVQPPVLAGGLLHVVSEGGRRLAALDPATGDTVWSQDIARYDGRIAHVGGAVLLTGPDSTVTALDAATGERMWRQEVAGLTQPVFQSYGGRVAYAVDADGAGTRVTAVDPQTGAVRWQRRLEGALGLVGARDGVLWFTSTSATYADTDAVVRYDAAQGTQRRVALRFPVAGAQAVVAQDTVYLLGADGALTAVDTAASEQRWRLETSVSFPSAPVVAGKRLYFSAGDGRLVAVDAARGALLGQTDARPGAARGAVVSGLPLPVAADGKVFAGAPDGVLFGVDGSRAAGW